MIKFRFSVRPQSVIYEVIQSEAVVMNLEAGIYFSFNEEATKLWEEIISGRMTDSEIFDYAGPQNRDFIDFLLDQELIFREPAPNHSAYEEKEPMNQNQVAQWETFSDLQDLLLLDPVHDIALNESGWPQSRKE